MSIVSSQATASHRYYMNKTKQAIRQRIKEMTELIPIDVSEHAMLNDKPDCPALWIWFLKIGVTDAIDGSWRKDELATIAMKAHSLLPEDGK